MRIRDRAGDWLLRYMAPMAVLLLIGSWAWLLADPQRLPPGWTVLTCGGTLFAVWNLWDVIDDYRGRDRAGDDPEVLEIQARANVITQTLIAVTLGGEFGAGLTSLVGLGGMALVLLIGSTVALIGLSIHQRIERRKLMAATALTNLMEGGVSVPGRPPGIET